MSNVWRRGIACFLLGSDKGKVTRNLAFEVKLVRYILQKAAIAKEIAGKLGRQDDKTSDEKDTGRLD